MSRLKRPDKDEYLNYHIPAEAYMDQCEADIAELVDALKWARDICPIVSRRGFGFFDEYADRLIAKHTEET